MYLLSNEQVPVKFSEVLGTIFWTGESDTLLSACSALQTAVTILLQIDCCGMSDASYHMATSWQGKEGTGFYTLFHVH